MNVIAKHGVLLGILVVVWTFVMGFTGWYKHPALLNLFWAVILINIAVVVLGLRQTAEQGRRYGGQIGAGVMIGLIGGVLIVVGSLVFTTVAFPDYFDELRAIQEERLVASGMPDDQIAMTLDMMEKTQTPVFQAISGFVGTVLTSLVTSLIAAIFIRKK
jgi:hypothetical protein